MTQRKGGETPPLLDPEAITQGETLGLMARFIVEGYMAGEHKSPMRGFSIEFNQHRPYVAGDDVRHLDWKVLGRTDRYYLKQYDQETNFVAHILLDGSESMNYGAGISKLEYGKRMAACLAYLILRQRDAVSVAVFDEAVDKQHPRTGNLASIHNIMNVLAAFEATRPTRIASVLHDVAGRIKRRGLVFVISDLFDDEQQILDGIQHIRFSGSEVIVMHTMDADELNFPFQGLVEFEGMETTGRVVTRPAEIRKSYLQELEAFQKRLREGCEKQNCHYILVNTARPLHETIAGYLAFRQRTTRK
jgi:uncharacterized protein (DUF58 family)